MYLINNHARVSGEKRRSAYLIQTCIRNSWVIRRDIKNILLPRVVQKKCRLPYPASTCEKHPLKKRQHVDSREVPGVDLKIRA